LEQSGFPYELVFAFTTAVRFVPVLADEAQMIMDAQKARGLELERRQLYEKNKKLYPILIPLIVMLSEEALNLLKQWNQELGALPKNELTCIGSR